MCPVRAAWVRALGTGRSQKNDPNDARSVAIAALRADDLARVRADDHSRVLRLLSKRHRDLARLKNKAGCRLHALLLEMVPGGAGFRIEAVTTVNTLINEFEPVDAMGRQRLDIARELAADIDRYNQLLEQSETRILASTWNRSAVASIVHPRSSTQATILRRPRGVSDAFGCWVLT